MAVRNGTDVTESTVEVRGRLDGTFDVVSVVTTLEYTACSSDLAKFLATELQDLGQVYPRPTDGWGKGA